MIPILLTLHLFSLFINSWQYEFKAEIGTKKTIMQLYNATNINITQDESQHFCWIEYQKLEVQKSILLYQDDLSLMNKYHYLIAQQERIWVLMNDMILTQISLSGIILNQIKLNGTLKQFAGYQNEKSEKPLILIDNQIQTDTEINISKGMIKVLDGFLFVLSKSLFIYEMNAENISFFGQIDTTKYDAIVDYDIKKVDDKKYYFYILDKVYGLNILKVLLKQNNINYKQLFSFLKPDPTAKSLICSEQSSCFVVYQSELNVIQNFKISFLESSVQILPIYHSEHKIVALVNLGDALFIQHKSKHNIYIYGSETLNNIEILGLLQISQVNSTLFYAITKTKLIKFDFQISQPKVICQCLDSELCTTKQNYQIFYKEKSKDVNLTFSIEFEMSFENQLNAAIATIISIIILFLIFLFVFWIYSLKAQLTCLEEKIKQGYAFMQKHKLPIFHTLENLAFTFRGAETLSKRIQQQDSQEIQETY